MLRSTLLAVFLGVFSLSGAVVPLSGWSNGATVATVPDDGKTPAVKMVKRGIYAPSRITVKPSTRYRLSFEFYEGTGANFHLDLNEYDAQGKLLPKANWRRHRDVFIAPHKSLRKVRLSGDLPFDTQPKCVALEVVFDKLNAPLYVWNVKLEELAKHEILTPDPEKEIPGLTMRGPDGVLYPDFSGAGVQDFPEKFEKEFPVRNYGALPDVQRDATPGIQAAVDAAICAGGGVVTLEKGVYHLYGKVSVDKSNVLIRGAGRGETKLVAGLPPDKLLIWNFARGNHLDNGTKLELFFPWKNAKEVTLSGAGKTLGKWQIPATASSRKLTHQEEYLLFLKLKKDSGFQRSAFDPELGRITLSPKKFLSPLPEGKVTLTLQMTGRDGKVKKSEFQFNYEPKKPYGSSHSILHFQGTMYSAPASRMPVASDLHRGDKVLTLASTHKLSDNTEFLLLTVPHNEKWDKLVYNICPWGTMRSSFFRIAKREGKVITLAKPVRFDAAASEGTYVNAFYPIRHCGVEALTVEQVGLVQQDLQANAIGFVLAADCRVRNVKVLKASVWPVLFTSVMNCTLEDAQLLEAWRPLVLLSYCGFDHGTDCLLQRVRTLNLRHAPLLNWASSGCVIRDSVFENSDGQLHSGWSMDNLFEQCRIIETTGKYASYGFAFYATPFNDGMHSAIGPRNVFYNCDAVSRSSAFYLGGMNRGYLMMYNRMLVNQGPGVIARIGCSGNRFQGNVFGLKQKTVPFFYNEYLDNSGNVFKDNQIYGGSGALIGGVSCQVTASGNAFAPFPADGKLPASKPPVPSLYLWQKAQTR